MTGTESDRVRERAQAAIARVGASVVAGLLAEGDATARGGGTRLSAAESALQGSEAERRHGETVSELVEIAARLDAQLWEQHRAGACQP